ncbi:hypothetical protein CSKR_106580 [Clonorchis sinensis]|uniref:Uncharacterized protein n=1 Tax=Clonorchis sinensis TaxID=79923 RepID=A0A3R7D4Z8_CLOSI|nr:hypothetical protein CSKR_106580 [Clonorchis sinensis]
MCCTRPPHISVATIFKISRYMYRRNALLIRLLKIHRQPTTSFALLGAHQVGAAPSSHQSYVLLEREIQLGSRWVSRKTKLICKLTETRGLRLPDEPQEGRNRSCAVEEVSATLSSALRISLLPCFFESFTEHQCRESPATTLWNKCRFNPLRDSGFENMELLKPHLIDEEAFVYLKG